MQIDATCHMLMGDLWKCVCWAEIYVKKKPYKLFSNIVVFVQGTVKFIKFVIFIENILIYQHSQKTLL